LKDVSILLAFSAGLLSFLSPCVLPLVPAYVSYLTGSAIKDLSKGKAKLYTLYKAIGFTIGFSIVFILMQLSIASIGSYLNKYEEYLRIIGGILVIIFGLHISGLIKIKFLYYEKRIAEPSKLGNSASSILLGMAFAAGWTPCIGPILGSILIYAQSMGTIYKGTILLVFYSLGLAMPFIFTALAIESFAKYFKKISKYMPVIAAISGLLVVAMGFLILSNRMLMLNSYFNFFNF
jgi:cytochrome c-type biogenesis protein